MRSVGQSRCPGGSAICPGGIPGQPGALHSSQVPGVCWMGAKLISCCEQGTQRNLTHSLVNAARLQSQVQAVCPAFAAFGCCCTVADDALQLLNCDQSILHLIYAQVVISQYMGLPSLPYRRGEVCLQAWCKPDCAMCPMLRGDRGRPGQGAVI